MINDIGKNGKMMRVRKERSARLGGIKNIEKILERERKMMIIKEKKENAIFRRTRIMTRSPKIGTAERKQKEDMIEKEKREKENGMEKSRKRGVQRILKEIKRWKVTDGGKSLGK